MVSWNRISVMCVYVVNIPKFHSSVQDFRLCSCHTIRSLEDQNYVQMVARTDVSVSHPISTKHFSSQLVKMQYYRNNQCIEP